MKQKKKTLQIVFILQLNPERNELRRTPQTLRTLREPFDENKFNFKQITTNELLSILDYNKEKISFIINKSPLTRYHIMICPNIEMGHKQQLTKSSLRFSIDFLRSLLSMEQYYLRIGYNSPGASSSVNHLHLHLLAIEKELYIDKAVSNFSKC